MIEEIKYSLQNIMHRKLRSFLTALSILIGITAIFTLISFGLGIKLYVDDLAASAGADKLFVTARSVGAPGTDSTFSLSKDDLNYVSKIKGVLNIIGAYAKPAEIEYRDEKKYSFLLGMDMRDTEFLYESMNIDIIVGRNIKPGESSKVVLGYSYLSDNKFFKRKVALGDRISVNGNIFEVVGFFSEVGNPQDDSQVYLSHEGFESVYPDVKDKFAMFFIQAEKGVDVKDLSLLVKDKLRRYKDQEKDKETFYVQTYEDALNTFGTILDILNGILILIALVSLLVATVNIMNTMYTAVLERTKEIGIMKAMGAANSSITFIFMFEAGFLGLLGGIFGVLLGFIASSIGGAIATGAGYALLKPTFPWYLTAGCILFAMLVGTFAGYFPARQASRLKPVDALRYE